MKNLYVETVEALFLSDIKPWDVEDVTMVDNTCMSIIEMTWDEFTDLAKKVNYKPITSANVIAESLTVNCTDERKLVRSCVLGKEGWRYTEAKLYEHETAKNVSPKDFIAKCNGKELEKYYEIKDYEEE